MPRLFVAIRPPAAIRDRLTALQDGIDGARWQDDEQLHLTLRFIGDVDARTGDDAAAALSRVHASDFEIALSGVGSFGSRGRPHAIWAGVAPAAPLAALHKKIDHALVRIGLAPEGRAYVPHITLARLNRRCGPVDAFVAHDMGLSSEPFPAGHVILYESTLTREAAAYDPVLRLPLG